MRSFSFKSELVFEPVANDLLVFDGESNEAHSLSGNASRIAKLLVGTQTIESLSLASEIAPAEVAQTVSEFRELGLLADGAKASTLSVVAPDRVERRGLLAQGLMVTGVLGTVASIKVPNADAAASCSRGLGMSCASSSGSSCCISGCCCNTLAGKVCVVAGTCIGGCL